MNELKLFGSNFKLTYEDKLYTDKGYVVVHFSYLAGYRGSLNIYPDKVQITTPRVLRDQLVALALLGYLLKEVPDSTIEEYRESHEIKPRLPKGKDSPLVDSLIKEYKETGKFNAEFEKLGLDSLVDQYLDLINGKVSEEFLQDTKEFVRLTLMQMLRAVDEIKSPS